jgi:CubicO group peptidase (beta-lactamase class C family)
MRLSSRFAGLLGSILMMTAPLSSPPSPPPPPAHAATAAAAPAAVHPLAAADVDAWLDGFMPDELATGDIAGAVVVVVKDGQVLTARGYGYADVAARRPIDPERTVFRQGSITKLFTWTAVMQLVERGALDLDRDVNAYLDFRLPPRHGQPVTLRQLMTHTAGFENLWKGLSVPAGARLPALGEVVRAQIPDRIFPPGKVIAYSNYGAALAGYVVERAAGEPFAAAIARHILQPLGMTRSTLAQPLPPPLHAAMASGYLRGSGAPGSFEVTGFVPAGALSSTGADMARFMIAQLQDGRYGQARILAPATARLMQATAFQPYAPFPGMALGFYHEDRNGHVVVGHSGDTALFHCALHLFLADGVGLYVAMNSAGRDGAAGQLRRRLFEALADRYFPAPPAAEPPALPPARAAHDAALVAGSYVSTRRSESSFLRIAALLGETTVHAGADGTLTIDGWQTPGGAVARWREVAPLLWREVGGTARLLARLDHGRVTSINDDGAPIFEYQRATGIYAPIQVSLLLLALGVLAATAVLWPLQTLMTRAARGGSPSPPPPPPPALRRLVRAAAVVALAAAAGWVALLGALASDGSLLNATLDPWLRLVQILTLAAGPGGALVAICYLGCVVAPWPRGGRGWRTLASALLLTLAFLDLAWVTFALKLVTLAPRF